MKFEGLAIAAVVAVFTLIGTAAASPIGVDLLPDLGHVKRQACNRGIAFYDDQDAKLPMNYEGTWTMLKNQGSAFKGAGGTLSYTSQPNAMVTLIAAFPSGTTAPANITVWSSKKNDRGRFNVYVGQTLLGTGDQYTSASQETSTQRVFYRQNVLIPGGQPFVIKNDKGAPFMAFDAFEMEYCRL